MDRIKPFVSQVCNPQYPADLPKAIAFPESVIDVEITAIGNKWIIYPVGQSWDDWFAAPGVSSDFMVERQQPKDQLREPM